MVEEPIVSSTWFDNSAHSYSHIEARPYASSMGAEIVGVEVRKMSDAAISEFEDALFRHKMLFVRNQRLSDDEQEAFTRRLGPIATDAYDTLSAKDRHVTAVIKEADTVTPFIFGGGWHTDSPFMEQPPAITMLRSVQIPPYGGDTLFSNMGLAYRALSEPMKQMLAPLRVYMSAEHILRRVSKHMKIDRGFGSQASHDQAMQGKFHPLIRTHPRTGEKALYITGTYTCGFEGMNETEADYLHRFLFAHATQHAFTCRLRWESEMLVLWDNRLCLHMAMNDHDGFRREMYRSMVKGEVPA
jgi:alpha-ketoglutarate-dependent taurine dioxygenase